MRVGAHPVAVRRAPPRPAGPPPPIVLTDGSCQPLEPAKAGPLLGVFDTAEWPVTRTTLPLGGTIVLYTDGLIEARQGADTFGVERACIVLEAERRSALELRVERMIEAARRHVLGDPLEGDVGEREAGGPEDEAAEEGQVDPARHLQERVEVGDRREAPQPAGEAGPSAPAERPERSELRERGSG